MKPDLQSESGVACDVLAALSSSNRPSANAVEVDSDRKCRRRQARRSRQGRQHLDNEEFCALSNNGERQSSVSTADGLNRMATLRSANASPNRSSSCIRNASFRHTIVSSASFLAAKPSLKVAGCVAEIATSSCLKHDLSGASSVAFRSPVENDLPRLVPVTCSENTPSTSIRKFKESSPVQACKPKMQEDVVKNTSQSGDSASCSTNILIKTDCKRKGARKDAMRSHHVDSLPATSGGRCGCASYATQPSTLLSEESVSVTLGMENRTSGVEMSGAGSSQSGSRSNRSVSESPAARFLKYKALPNHYLNMEGDFGQWNSYVPHWPLEKVSQALELGLAFCSKLRVNMHNRNEAYISLEGVPTDILIDGLQAQNRAIDGDLVAFVLNPVPSWPGLRGFLKKKNSDDQVTEQLVQNSDLPPVELQESSSDKSYCDSGESGKQDANLFDDTVEGLNILSGNCLSNSGTNNFTECSSWKIFLGLDDQPEDVSRETRVRSLLDTNDVDSCLLERFEAIDLVRNCANRESEDRNATKALALLATCVASFPDKRPTGNVVAILDKSRRRETVIGFLKVHPQFTDKVGGKVYCATQKDSCHKLSKGMVSFNNSGSMMLLPTDSRLPKMSVSVDTLPDYLRKRFRKGDLSLRHELVAGKVAHWEVDSVAPVAIISHVFGKGGELKAQAAAILFEHAIHSSEFPLDALACLPKMPWVIPTEEFCKRRDLRDCRIFTIDPPAARDLDDALSIEFLSNDIVRVGVHIADVSFFVHPDTALDREAQVRSTSVYLTQCMMPMLPPLLCEEICSLNPGVDRLAFSIFWDFDTSGKIIDHWMGRTIIRCCCKLTYQHAQEMVGGMGRDGIHCGGEALLPDLHGGFKWNEVIDDVKALHEIAQKRRECRFKTGALRLECSKIVFAMDEDGIPYDIMLSKQMDSNILVEEFMLLANMTAAKVISSAFPDCALLRRHPGPSMRKLKEFEEFCYKNGFEVDVSSSGALHESLRKLGEELKDDSSLCSILMLYATKPMQLAKYFCTGQFKDREDDWAHYSLAASSYTHFTSPMRRYADIVVHRTLAAAIEAEEILFESCLHSKDRSKSASHTENQHKTRWLTGLTFDKETAHSPGGKMALAIAASKHKVPGCKELNVVAEHCNERKLASRNAMEASDKLYLWAMLKRKQQVLSDARVLAVGPKFLSLYISGIAMERRIYYDDTEGLQIEWLEATGTVVLDLVSQVGKSKKSRYGKHRTIDDVAFVVKPAYDGSVKLDSESIADVCHKMQESFDAMFKMTDKTVDIDEELNSDRKVVPAVLPLTLRFLSPVTVSVYAFGGENGPLDIAVRLYLSSYLYQSPVS